MVAGDDQDVRAEFLDTRQARVKFLGFLNLGGEVTVFSRAIGVLVMNEEEIVFIPVLGEQVHLFGESLWLPDDFHPYQPC